MNTKGFGGNYGSTSDEYRDDPGGFNQYSDSSPFGGGQSPGRGGVDTSQLYDKISTNIFKINSNATTLERSCRQIGTGKDSKELRDRIHSSEQSTNYLIRETAEAFHDLSRALSGSNRSQKLMFERLKNDFKETVKRYNTVQKSVAEKVKSSVRLSRSVLNQSNQLRFMKK